MEKFTKDMIRIFIVSTIILSCLGFSSIMLFELDTYRYSFFEGRPYAGPYFEIGVYAVYFFVPILIYFIPHIVGVAIVMTRINVYSSKAKRGFIGLTTGLLGAIMIFILEYYISFGRANTVSEIYKLLPLPFGLTIISIILFVTIPSVIKGRKREQ